MLNGIGSIGNSPSFGTVIIKGQGKAATYMGALNAGVRRGGHPIPNPPFANAKWESAWGPDAENGDKVLYLESLERNELALLQRSFLCGTAACPENDCRGITLARVDETIAEIQAKQAAEAEAQE